MPARAKMVERQSTLVGPKMEARAQRNHGGRSLAHRQDTHAGSGPVWPVALLLVSFVIPWLFPLGPMVLSAYRLVLIVLIGPSFIALISGRAGPLRITDAAVLGYCLWCVLSLAVVHGPESAFEAGGILVVESFGAYLVARCYVRSLDQFVAAVRVAFGIVAVLTPFAVIETLTGVNLARSMFSALLPTFQPIMANDMRAGLTRAMTIFEHPILFGVFAGSLLALVHIVLGKDAGLVRRWSQSLVICLATACSLSSGPMGVLALQIALIFWNWVLRGKSWRWPLIWGLLAISYVLVDLVSNQSPIQVYMSRLTFSQDSAWYRFLIWDYGSASILANPLFGVGFGNWVRPRFMSESFDMFWLLPPLRHGIPAGLFLYLAFASVYFGAMLKRIERPDIGEARIAYLICLTAYALTGWAVHFWGVSYAMFFFLLGAGMWLLETQMAPQASTAEEKPARHRSGSAVPVRRPRLAGSRSG